MRVAARSPPRPPGTGAPRRRPPTPGPALDPAPLRPEEPTGSNSFTLLTFDDGPCTVYADTAMAGQMIDSPAEVELATTRYDRIRASALSPDAATGTKAAAWSSRPP
ncbi:Scr1 family TA system antitoxin-like transcriptional regulator [Streptomyces rugosispiralis]|uniref:Scr1 family TA system antitoxin-like transcriptional regulator n=1 Tax=Streptomyces rugosispiralis TaxID=2967341 RepID=A0ABT1UWN0_9ACTN|nr:Scr1 family TA system antitoxin-like transcriptional regulator [Streptomyces rugosispiralis]MCQ8189528.1 Scr1 family TA system antitoxin-like transcriptional regulator [Streptomyces rugosispiralis]